MQPDAHRPAGPTRAAWRRFRAHRTAVASGVILALIALAGLLAPLLARHVTHFSESEQHTALRLMPAGTKDVSRDFPRYDGDRSSFALLDGDGDGLVCCAREPLQPAPVPGLPFLRRFAPPLADDVEARLDACAAAGLDVRDFLSATLGPLRCPDVERLAAAERFFEFLFARHDGRPGGATGPGFAFTPAGDGRISAAEFPLGQADAQAALQALGLSGPTAFARLDADRDGYVSPAEVVRATRPLRHTAEALVAAADRDGDLCVSRAEYPGAPRLETFWLGTDAQGRDVLTRLLYGARISLLVALCATFVAFLVGVSYGAIAGYAGGRIDGVMMRAVDVLYGLPFMFLLILLLVVVGRNLVHLFLALGLVQWLTMARVVRGQVLALRRRAFILAAESLGLPRRTIVFRHLVPNALGPVLAYAALMVPGVIVEEAFLSFLGLGVAPPHASWGVLIAEGAARMETHPWLIVWPAVALLVTLYALNFLAEGLRDALDPRTERRP